jgi:hypothetical protein
MMLQIVPQYISEAMVFVRQHHRTHEEPPGALFALGVADGARLCGVAIVGRPVSRIRQTNEPFTAELLRVCTDGTKNANSKLYAAAWRAARQLGWRKLISKTLPEESGIGPKAAGYKCLGVVPGGKWHRELRPRLDNFPTGVKLLWQQPAQG